MLPEKRHWIRSRALSKFFTSISIKRSPWVRRSRSSWPIPMQDWKWIEKKKEQSNIKTREAHHYYGKHGIASFAFRVCFGVQQSAHTVVHGDREWVHWWLGFVGGSGKWMCMRNIRFGQVGGYGIIKGQNRIIHGSVHP